MDRKKNTDHFLQYVTEWYADFDAHAARRMLLQHYENLAAEAVGFMRRQLEFPGDIPLNEKDLLVSLVGFVMGWLVMYPVRGSDLEQRAYRDRLKDESKRVLEVLRKG